MKKSYQSKKPLSRRIKEKARPIVEKIKARTPSAKAAAKKAFIMGAVWAVKAARQVVNTPVKKHKKTRHKKRR